MTTKTFSTGKTWSVGCKKHAISKPAEDIALRYGKNVSRGILEMEAVIQTQKKEIADIGAWIDERV